MGLFGKSSSIGPVINRRHAIHLPSGHAENKDAGLRSQAGVDKGHFMHEGGNDDARGKQHYEN